MNQHRSDPWGNVNSPFPGLSIGEVSKISENVTLRLCHDFEVTTRKTVLDFNTSLSKRISELKEHNIQDFRLTDSQMSRLQKQNKILEKKVGVLKDMIDILCLGSGMESENLLDLSLIDQEFSVSETALTPAPPIKKEEPERNYWGKSYVHNDHSDWAIKNGGEDPHKSYCDDSTFPGLELPDSGLGLDVITRELAAYPHELISPIVTLTQEQYERHAHQIVPWRG